jgi:fido (protein-threonine AMPylation protein)
MSLDPYVDPATGVLLNRLGITDADSLWQAVADISAARLDELAARPLPGAYDLSHLMAFHKVIFGDVFTWAGQLRTVQIFKETGFACRSTSPRTLLASSPSSPKTPIFGACPSGLRAEACLLPR